MHQSSSLYGLDCISVMCFLRALCPLLLLFSLSPFIRAIVLLQEALPQALGLPSSTQYYKQSTPCTLYQQVESLVNHISAFLQNALRVATRLHSSKWEPSIFISISCLSHFKTQLIILAYLLLLSKTLGSDMLRWMSAWQVLDQTVSCSGVWQNWPGHY